jgi:hypothetical protein
MSIEHDDFMKNLNILDKALADDDRTETVTITREDFDAACGRAVQKSDGRNITYGKLLCFSDLVAKELGL